MANFIPEQEKYKELTPFKLHCLTQFPYIDADFDALTNWELLCKIVDYLNNVIDNENKVENNVSGLYNAYVSLQGYVNNYFDTLNVQSEINNKLDDMARDGSLSNLIKEYIDPIVNEQDIKITSIENKVNSVASGSPLVANSLSDMTDTTRVYVLTTDGKWYYYNGSSWVVGGTYQSTGLDSSTDYILSLSEELLPFVKNVNYNRIDISKAVEGYINNTGGVSTDSNNWYATEYIAVKPGQKLIITANNNNALYDKNKGFVRLLNSETVETWYRKVAYGLLNNNTDVRLLIVPNNVYYIRLTISKTNNYQHQMFEYNDENKDCYPLMIKSNPVSLEILKTPIKDIYLSDIITELEKDNIISSNKIKFRLDNIVFTDSVGTNAQYQSTTSNFCACSYLKCIPGEKYIISDTATIVYMDENYYSTKILQSSSSEYPVETIDGKYVLTMPENVSYICIHTNKASTPFPYAYKILNEQLISSISIPTDAKNAIYDINMPATLKDIISRNLSTQSILNGKTIDVFGDSISSTDYTMPYWGGIISSRTGCTINNYGISGTTLAHTNDRHLWDYHFGRLDANEIGYVENDPSTWSTGNCFCERFTKVNTNADAIVIMGGTNDGNVPLGTWSSTDTSTFYGALNVLLSGISKNMAGKKIIMCTPIQTANDYTNNVDDALSSLKSANPSNPVSLRLRSQAIIQKCKQYGINCIDLFNTSGINGIDNSKIYYRNNDTLHPSSYGQERIASIIQSRLEELLK